MGSEIVNVAITAMVVGAVFALLLKRVLTVGRTVNSASDYLFARSATSKGLDRSTTVFTAVASNFQTANALFVGLFFGYNFGFVISVLSIMFAGGVWLLYSLLRRLGAEQRSDVLQSQVLPYERIFGGRNRVAANVVVSLIYISIIFGAVTEIWFGSRMATDAIDPLIAGTLSAEQSTRDLSVAIVASVLGGFLFCYVYFGGYLAVAVTDRIQTILISLLLGILLVSTILLSVLNYEGVDWSAFLLGVGDSYSDTAFIVALLCGAAALNIFWQLVLPTQWQRAAASESADTYVESLPGAAIGTVVTWMLPVLIGAIAAASGEAGASAIPQPLAGWYQLGATYPEAAAILGPVIAAVIGIAVAGIFSAALSTADTAIIIVVTKIAQSSPGIGWSLRELRRNSILIVAVVCVLAGWLYYLDPPIDKLIFSISTGQMFFAAFFWRYIITGGTFSIADTRAAVVVCAVFVTAFSSALIINLSPTVAARLPNLGFWLPVIVLIAGFVVVRIFPRNEARPS